MKHSRCRGYGTTILLFVLMAGFAADHARSRAAEGTSREEFASLVRQSQNGEYPAWSSALDTLGKIGGPEAAEAIIAALPRLNPTGQETFCRVLGAIGDNRAIEPLIKVLTTRGTERADVGEGIFKVRARAAAAEALGRFRDPRSRAALIGAIKDDPDWEVYHAAREALYRMEGVKYYPDYDGMRGTLALAVSKKPEPPEGAEEAVRKWREENAHYRGSWIGPGIEDYASQVDIKRARENVIHLGKAAFETGEAWNTHPCAGLVAELLMEYLCNRKFTYGPENAKALLIRIGKPALPALENGVKRGDPILVKTCQQCIEAIRAAEAGSPTAGNRALDSSTNRTSSAVVPGR